MTGPYGTQIAVIGGGITGLVAARLLADAGMHPIVFEARDGVGGQVRTRRVAGADVDVGAEALHTASPDIGDLLRQLQLADQVIPARTGTTWLATSNGLRRLPAGVGPAGPTRLWPVVTSRVLSPAGLVRAGLEPFARPVPGDDDVAVGHYLAGRFGAQVTSRLVDPLLGNLHAGDIERLSLAATLPHLDRLARTHRSVILGRRGTTPTRGAPGFVTLRGGLEHLAEVLAADSRLQLHRATRVNAIASRGDHVLIDAGGQITRADAAVLAVPAAMAARLLAAIDPGASVALAGIRTATVATVIVGYPRTAVSCLDGNGLLVPSASGQLLKAATFLGNKWPHLADRPTFLVRLSAGRVDDPRLSHIDDEELVSRLHNDLAAFTGLHAMPTTAVVQRWPATMPQLEVGHRDRVAQARSRLAGRRIALAGAAYDGVGIANCLTSARQAVHDLVPVVSCAGSVTS